MDNEHRRGKWQEYANVIVPFLGPVLFEIANSVTGEWVTAENKLSLSTGKVITIIIGIVYIGVMIYLIWIDKLNRKTVDEIENALEDMKKRETMYKKSMNTVCNLLAYSGEKLKNQIEYLKEHDRIDVRDLNINAASTNIANRNQRRNRVFDDDCTCGGNISARCFRREKVIIFGKE